MPSNAERHQHLDRSQMELHDQHGRLWYVQSEVGIDAKRRPRIAPVGTFDPSFAVPYDFYPAQKFLEYDARRPGQLYINYDAWIAENRAAHEAVHRELVQVATRLYKSEAAKFIKDPTDEMREIVYGQGKGPEPVEPIIAAKQGNEWVLGIRAFDPKLPGDVRLKPYLDRWVEVRYRDVRLDEGDAAVEALDFTEGQATDEITDDELEELTAPAAKK